MDTTDLAQDRDKCPEYGNETSCSTKCVWEIQVMDWRFQEGLSSMESINNVRAVSLYQVVSRFDVILMLFHLMPKILQFWARTSESK
jgi:hypothetical protein